MIFKYFRPKIPVFLIAILAILLFSAQSYFEISFSIFAVISFLLFAIDQWLWRKIPFKWLFWIDDFSGRYEGILKYTFKDENGEILEGELKHVKVIHQTGSRITIHSFTSTKEDKSSKSESKGVLVEKGNGDNHYDITYTYQNQGTVKWGPHNGTDVLKFYKKNGDKYLSGGYYTNRLPYATRGEYTDLKWVSSNQEHEF